MSSDNPKNAPVVGAAQTSGLAPSGTDATLSETLIMLRKRRALLIIAVLLGLMIGFYRAVKQERRFEAFGRIQVRAGSSNEFKLNSASLFEDDPQRKLQTEVAILTSDTLLATVARDLNLANNPAFTGAKGPVQHRNFEDLAVRQEVVGQLQATIQVAPVPKTDLIRISYVSGDAKLSADIVNKLIVDYIQRSYETRFASTQRVSQWLSSQLDDLKQQVETSQEQMMDLQKKLGTLGFDSTKNETSSALDDLAKAAANAKLNRILAESRYRLPQQRGS